MQTDVTEIIIYARWAWSGVRVEGDVHILLSQDLRSIRVSNDKRNYERVWVLRR